MSPLTKKVLLAAFGVVLLMVFGDQGWRWWHQRRVEPIRPLYVPTYIPEQFAIPDELSFEVQQAPWQSYGLKYRAKVGNGMLFVEQTERSLTEFKSDQGVLGDKDRMERLLVRGRQGIYLERYSLKDGMPWIQYLAWDEGLGRNLIIVAFRPDGSSFLEMEQLLRIADSMEPSQIVPRSKGGELKDHPGTARSRGHPHQYRRPGMG